ncbi:hypothetical protein PN462_08200 [Spirulina sp. CS-785/01]|uniref:hypothetical protein n=1 Tax=Spirulina sp. CS-785/01 TaxID=3021716 RepID=UPI00232F9DC9|nr:hypothetical protein [Spirulina sp. CS-785/01]MDB9313079.1 hypothetical protein [Spirulina sp. CS-785/01]
MPIFVVLFLLILGNWLFAYGFAILGLDIVHQLQNLINWVLLGLLVLALTWFFGE